MSLPACAGSQVYSWGWNDRGTLGHGHRAHERKPRRVHALTGKKIVQVWGVGVGEGGGYVGDEVMKV